MRPDELERRLRERLDALGPAPQRRRRSIHHALNRDGDEECRSFQRLTTYKKMSTKEIKNAQAAARRCINERIEHGEMDRDAYVKLRDSFDEFIQEAALEILRREEPGPSPNC